MKLILPALTEATSPYWRPIKLKEGYDWAYREFYRWSSIARASLQRGTVKHQAKHFFYAAGWKKFEALWDFMIRMRQLRQVTPLLEAVFGRVTRGMLGEDIGALPEVSSGELVKIEERV